MLDVTGGFAMELGFPASVLGVGLTEVQNLCGYSGDSLEPAFGDASNREWSVEATGSTNALRTSAI